jgi:scyllo-inositol 2-dehydrogenase (NADP+)
MPAPLRVALIGYGLAGSAFHAPFIATMPDFRLAAIVTSDQERRARALRDHPGVSLFESADEIWAKPDEFDLVVVAAPNRAHTPLGLSALAAGLPVVVDKPLATTAAEAQTLVDAARERGLLLTVFQNRRWDGDFLTVRRLLADDALGRVLRFESRFERWRPEVGTGWRENADDAGGLLFDLGSHLADQAVQLFGPVQTVYAELEIRRRGAEVDDDDFVALEHAGGLRSHLWMSAVAAQGGARFRLLGDRAAYTKHGLDVQEDALRAGRSPNEPGWGEEPKECWGRLGAGEELQEVPTEPGSYGAFYEAVAASLRNGTPPPVDPVDAVEVLEVLEAARRSSLERKVVPLSRSTPRA